MKNCVLRKILIVSLIILGIIMVAGVVYMAVFSFVGIIAVAAAFGAAIPVLCEISRLDKALKSEKEDEKQ